MPPALSPSDYRVLPAHLHRLDRNMLLLVHRSKPFLWLPLGEMAFASVYSENVRLAVLSEYKRIVDRDGGTTRVRLCCRVHERTHDAKQMIRSALRVGLLGSTSKRHGKLRIMRTARATGHGHKHGILFILARQTYSQLPWRIKQSISYRRGSGVQPRVRGPRH